MKISVVGLIFALAVVQAKPNFSGTWTLVTPSTVNPKVVVVITQSDSTFTIKTPDDRTLVWQLDGSETTTQIQEPDGSHELKLRVRFDGPRLLVEQRTTTTTIIQTVSLSTDGTELTVLTVLQGPQGDQRSTQVFKKS
jgi:hypothetical protein